jgi:hypothetical protein
MEVEIGNVVSTVRAVDSGELLTPQILEKIVRAVLQAVQEKEEHHSRALSERRITGGVSEEREAEGL